VEVRTHGTVSGYRRGCRCRACTTANSDYVQQARVERAVRLQLDPSLVVHGSVSTYDNWMCRCPDCAEAQKLRLRRLRNAHRVAA